MEVLFSCIQIEKCSRFKIDDLLQSLNVNAYLKQMLYKTQKHSASASASASGLDRFAATSSRLRRSSQSLESIQEAREEENAPGTIQLAATQMSRDGTSKQRSIQPLKLQFHGEVGPQIVVCSGQFTGNADNTNMYTYIESEHDYVELDACDL